MPEKINLLPEAEIKQVRVNPYLAWFLKTGFYFLVSTYIAVTVAFGFRWYQESSLSDLNDQIIRKRDEIRLNTEFMKEYKNLQDRYGVVAGLISNYTPKSKYLLMIEETIPEPIRLVSAEFQVQSNTLQIQGVSSDYLIVDQWRNDLSDEEFIAGIDIKSVGKTKATDLNDPNAQLDNGVDFVFEIQLK